MTSELFFRELGTENEATLVLLAGGGMSGWMWEQNLPDLAGYHILVPDLPEHGRSRSAAPFQMQAAAELVAGLVRRKAHGGKAHLVGISLGGQVIVEMLARHGDVIDHAVVISANVRGFPAGSLLTDSLKWAGFLARYEWFARLQARQLNVPEALFPAYFEDSRSTSGETLARVTRASLEYRMPAGLGKAAAPTLILVGEREYGFMKRSGRDLAAALPNGQAYVVQGGWHTLNFEAPDRFAQIVKAWTQDKDLPEGLLPL